MEKSNGKSIAVSVDGEQNSSSSELISPRFFGTAEEMMRKYSHCALCGAYLHFTHQTDFSRGLTQEMAKCLECGVQVKNILHRLQ